MTTTNDFVRDLLVNGLNGLPVSANSMLDIALGYAKKGWSVLPLHTPEPSGCSCGARDCWSIGKHPRVLLIAASIDEAKIREWWNAWPNANVGIALGESKHSATISIAAISIDANSHGLAHWADLTAAHGHGEVVSTLEVGGIGSRRSVIFLTDGPVRNSINKLAGGIDVLGEGSFICMPPSLQATGHRYVFNGSTTSVAKMPGWLYELCKEKTMLTTPAAPTTLVTPAAPTKTAQDYAEELVQTVRSRRPAAVGGSQSPLYRVEIGVGEKALPVGPEADEKNANQLRSMFVDAISDGIERIMEDLGHPSE